MVEQAIRLCFKDEGRGDSYCKGDKLCVVSILPRIGGKTLSRSDCVSKAEATPYGKKYNSPEFEKHKGPNRLVPNEEYRILGRANEVDAVIKELKKRRAEKPKKEVTEKIAEQLDDLRKENKKLQDQMDKLIELIKTKDDLIARLSTGQVLVPTPVQAEKEAEKTTKVVEKVEIQAEKTTKAVEDVVQAVEEAPLAPTEPPPSKPPVPIKEKGKEKVVEEIKPAPITEKSRDEIYNAFVACLQKIRKQ